MNTRMPLLDARGVMRGPFAHRLTVDAHARIAPRRAGVSDHRPALPRARTHHPRLPCQPVPRPGAWLQLRDQPLPQQGRQHLSVLREEHRCAQPQTPRSIGTARRSRLAPVPRRCQLLRWSFAVALDAPLRTAAACSERRRHGAVPQRRRPLLRPRPGQLPAHLDAVLHGALDAPTPVPCVACPCFKMAASAGDRVGPRLLAHAYGAAGAG